MIEKGLIVDHPFDRLALTMWGPGRAPPRHSDELGGEAHSGWL
jgi:hypothetical protein